MENSESGRRSPKASSCQAGGCFCYDGPSWTDWPGSRVPRTVFLERRRPCPGGLPPPPPPNPPEDGGFKYNPTDGGPADTDVTSWVEERANGILAEGLASGTRGPSSRGPIGA